MYSHRVPLYVTGEDIRDYIHVLCMSVMQRYETLHLKFDFINVRKTLMFAASL